MIVKNVTFSGLQFFSVLNFLLYFPFWRDICFKTFKHNHSLNLKMSDIFFFGINSNVAIRKSIHENYTDTLRAKALDFEKPVVKTICQIPTPARYSRSSFVLWR